MTTDGLRDRWTGELKNCEATIRALQAARKRASDLEITLIGYKLARQNIRREVMEEALDLLRREDLAFVGAEAQDRSMIAAVKRDWWEKVRLEAAEAMEGEGAETRRRNSART